MLEADVITSEVLILGAGMAGISAAKRLREKGLENVVVVEGSDRIGGRVKDVHFGGINVEVGANWVHFSNMKKTEMNPIELMVAEAKLNFVPDDYSDVIYRYKGSLVLSHWSRNVDPWLSLVESFKVLKYL